MTFKKPVIIVPDPSSNPELKEFERKYMEIFPNPGQTDWKYGKNPISPDSLGQFGIQKQFSNRRTVKNTGWGMGNNTWSRQNQLEERLQSYTAAINYAIGHFKTRDYDFLLVELNGTEYSEKRDYDNIVVEFYVDTSVLAMPMIKKA